MDPFWKQLFTTAEMRALDNSERATQSAHIAGVDASIAAATAARAELGVRTTEAKVIELENRLFGLGLYTRTILQLLIEKGVLTEEEFSTQMRALDLLDGKEDGR